MFLFSMEMNKNIFNVWFEFVQEKILSIQFAFLVPNLSVDNDEANQHEFVENSFTPLRHFRSLHVNVTMCTSVVHHSRNKHYWLLW